MNRPDGFAVFCDAVAIYHENRALLGNTFMEQGAAGGKIKSPHWQIMRDCQSIMAQFGGRFGLTPVDRAALKVDAEEKPTGAERLLSQFSVLLFDNYTVFPSPSATICHVAPVEIELRDHASCC